jgi:hypothetical protein
MRSDLNATFQTHDHHLRNFLSFCKVKVHINVVITLLILCCSSNICASAEILCITNYLIINYILVLLFCTSTYFLCITNILKTITYLTGDSSKVINRTYVRNSEKLCVMKLGPGQKRLRTHGLRHFAASQKMQEMKSCN